MIVMDVDGTLTDGMINIGENGELFKSFNSKDGFAISVIMRKHDIVPVIITGRESSIVRHRAKELNITELYQGITDKTSVLKEICVKYNISVKSVAYIGDDLNDINCMKICGFVGCPSDAADEVKEIANYVCQKSGGSGAVREFTEWLVAKMNK